MIHVYAVTDATRLKNTVTGAAGEPVELISAGGLSAAATRHGDPVAPGTEAILAHAGVCDALQQMGATVLPVRFGARYTDDAAVREDMGTRAGSLMAALRHVRGRVEIGVRVADPAYQPDVPPTPAAAPPASGAAYLQRRKAEEDRQQDALAVAQGAANEIHEVLRGSAVDAVTNVSATSGLLLSAAYLVPADHVRTFAAKVEQLGRKRTDLQLLCTGPWPPYHFTGDGDLTGPGEEDLT